VHPGPLPSDGRGRIVLRRSAYPTALETARDGSGCSLSRRTGYLFSGSGCRAATTPPRAAAERLARAARFAGSLCAAARGATRRSATSSTTLNRSFGHSRGPVVVPRCAHHRRQGKEFLVSTIRSHANSFDSRLPENALPAMLRTKF